MSVFNDPYADTLHESVIKLYREFKPRIKEYVLKFQSTRSLFEAYYQVLVNKKELIPIEEQDIPYRTHVWDLTKGVGTEQERIKAARALYVIQVIEEKKIWIECNNPLPLKNNSKL